MTVSAESHRSAGIAGEARWRQAQAAEARYWDGLDVAELLRIAAEKPAFLALVGPDRAQRLFDGKDVLEIGCGPLGLSLASFHPNKAAIRRLVKVEPLPRRRLADTAAARASWAAPFVGWIDALTEEGEYLQSAGEELDVRGFDTVITYNVLDHVRDPMAVLARGRAALKPGGTILVGVDCLSVAGRARFEHVTRRLARGSILVEAHPHSFLEGQVRAMMARAGFEAIDAFGVPGALKRWVGGSYRPAFLARRPQTEGAS